MKLEVHEVFDAISKAKNREDKIQILKDNNHHAVRDIIKGGMDPKVEWLLPKGRPPFKANIPESAPSSLLKENRKFTYFIKGGAGKDITPVKRESIFIGVLESIHPADAELVLNMVAKKIPVKGLTRKIVQEAYPGLLS